jgi:hypothetical protein
LEVVAQFPILQFPPATQGAGLYKIPRNPAQCAVKIRRVFCR